MGEREGGQGREREKHKGYIIISKVHHHKVALPEELVDWLVLST